MGTAEGLTSTKAVRLRSLQKNQEGIPEAYVNDTDCERKCTDLVQRFRDNFPKDLQDRLFLRPANEYGIKKFVCSHLQPTLLPYPELYDLKQCANFVARYCQYEPLEEEKPEQILIVSPAQTLKWAVGDCFDCSFLLASILIGAGHDAFVVFGTAPEWIRLKDQRHMQCSLAPRSRDDDELVPWSLEMSIKDEFYAQKPSCNDGLHCWVLVKMGKRELDGGEDFFIEPSTGISYPVCGSPFCQVFSIWNDRNCWLNIGEGTIDHIDCADGWVPVLPDANSAPFSWANAIDLPREMYLLRYPPDGKRTINVNKAKVELYGERADAEGVKVRIIQYEDAERNIVLECTELFYPEIRADHMIQRTRRPMENEYHEYFSRESDVSERKEVGNLRSIKFHEKTRADGLVERIEEFGSHIVEHFSNRSLYKRVIEISLFQKDAKKPKCSELVPIGNQQLAEIERIDEYFKAPNDERNLEKSVARRSYLLKHRTIKVTYHCEHEVLRREENHSKDEIENDSLFGKELISLQNASVSAVKKTQMEMVRISESKYNQERKMVENSESTFTTEVKSTSLSSLATVKKSEGNEGIAIDYLSPYLGQIDQAQGRLSKEEATRVMKECLADAKERLMGRAKVIQTKLNSERLAGRGADADPDVSFRIKLLEKRLSEHGQKAIENYKSLEQRLRDDIRLASLHDSE